MIFGQVVIGPAGSGKSTYCKAMKEFMKGLGRKTVVVNLDSGNDNLSYDCLADITELITVEDEMKFEKLGPNYSVLRCMEYLEENLEWLMEKLDVLTPEHYILFDFPGQIELFITHDSVRGVISSLTKDNKFSLCAVHLVDSVLCSSPMLFINATLISLLAMLKLQLPHINVLSKVDLIEKCGSLPFNLDFYTEVLDLKSLLELVDDDGLLARKKKLMEKLAELVEDYGLVNFLPLFIEDKLSLMNILKHADKANGCIYGPDPEKRMANFLKCNLSLEMTDLATSSLQEKFIDASTKGFGDLN